MDPETEYAEFDVAEDGAGNFLVYRRGAWYPSDKDGKLLQSIPADDWEAGAIEMPNGTIMGPRGSRGGQRKKIGQAEGPASDYGEAPAVTSELRGRLAFGLPNSTAGRRRMAAMERGGENPLNRDWGASALALLPGGDLPARVAGGQDYQTYDQSIATLEAAILPIFSGLAVTDSEAARFLRANTPRLGDTPETVAEKGANIERVLNTGAWMMGQDIPFPEQPLFDPASEGFAGAVSIFGEGGGPGGGPINPETGLPSYPTIQRLTQNATELPLTPQEMGAGPSDPENGPGSSESNPFVLEGSNSADVYNALKDGGWVQGPDGRVYELPPGVVLFATPEEGDVQVSPGVFQRAQTPEEEVSERGRMNGILRRVDAFVRGAADTATFGLADEIAAGAETVLPLTGGASGWSEGFGNAYRQNIARERAVDRSDAQAVPVSRISGQVAGALGNPGTAAGARFISRAPNLGYAMTRSAAVGVPAGALYGAGAAEGGLPERGQGMMTGGAAGAATGFILPPVGAAARFLTAPIARPVGNFISDTARAATGRGLTPDEKAARALLRGRDPAAMRTAADEMRSFGAQPTVADVGGSVVQGRTRVAATRQGEGRQVAEDFAAGRRSDIQDYTSGLGRIVSDTEATPSQIEGMLEQYQRQASAPAFAAARASGAIDVSPETARALYSPEGRRAMQQASRLYAASGNPDEVALAAELQSLAKGRPRRGQAVSMSVGAADLLSRHLKKAGAPGTNEGRIFGGLGNAIRTQATDQSAAYREALTGFAQRARLGDANEIGQRFTGKGTARDFVAGVENMGPDGRQIARMAARSGIEKAAETPAGSMGMLDRLAVGRGQRQRSEALLDPAEAQRLQRGGQIGRQLVSTAQNVNPRAGSNTFLNFADGEEMAGGGVIGNALRGRFLTAAGGAIDLMRSRGISGDQADRIVSLALDPARTDEAIQILSTRLSPGVAARTVEAIQRAANPAISAQMGGAQGGQQSRAVSMTNPTF